MKKFLLSFVSLFVLTFVSFAANVASASLKSSETPEPASFEYGKYLIKNVGSGLFWGAANDWGTQASLVENPQYVKLVPQAAENVYKLESQVNNGGEQYYFNNGGYMDGGIDVSVDLVIAKLENGNYSIANSADGTFYGYDGMNSVLGKGLAAEAGQNIEWTIVSLDDAKANLSGSLEAPSNATFFIEDATFGRNNRYVNKWINESGAVLTGGNSNKHCAEKYHGDFNVYQTVTGLPKGLYRFTAQGFYRQDGSDNEHLPVFYANEAQVTLPLLTGAENSMADACASFEKGLYNAEAIYFELGEDESLTVGVKLEGNGSLWCIWDNFTLMYYGAEASLNELRFADLIAQVNALKAEAEELKADENLSSPTATALETAISGAEEIEATVEAYNAVIASLNAAVAQARKDAANKSAIDAMYALVESTNFYTADALATYKAEADGYKEAWEAGTLTTSVDNPATVHAWHAGNSYDNLLLSTWSINDVQCDEFTTNLHVNTWSTEGETDGTEFKVPFFEYWTGDGESLGTSTLNAKVTGLEAGYYEVSAWIRVRAKNGIAAADATGITATVNGGAAVDVTEGNVVEGSQFSLAEYHVNGMVGEDGNLTFSLNVVADNNISWLSFKNVTYTKKDETEVAYEDALASIEDGGTYRVFTEVNEQKLYLTAAGYLVEDSKKAATFTFNAVNAVGTLYSTGWNLGCKFTNPSLTGGSTGDIVQNGHINVGGNDRDDWERQVFFLKDGKYAVRATNANSANWGANTYWDVVTYNELPAGGYSLDASYVWQIEANVDNRPEAFYKIQTWAAKLQAVEGLVQDAKMYTSNAKESKEGSYEALLDGEYTTFFHSSWSAAADEDHYLQAELPDAAKDFYIYFKKRSQNNNNRPTDIVISGSNDGENFTQITEINEGLPTGATPLDYVSAEINADQAYKYLRFTVLATNNNAAEGNGHKFFTFSEFYILPSNGLIAEAAPYMVGDYTDLEIDDIDAINAIDDKIALAKAQTDLAADIEALNALADRLQAQVDATSTYEGADAASAATAAVTAVKVGTYLTKEDIDAAKVQLFAAAKAFFAGITAKESIDVTEWFIVNPAALTKNGWEGTDFGTASNGVCEYWNKAAAEFHQTISLPAGTYQLTGIALTRTDMSGTIYAGEQSVAIATVEPSVANSRATAADWFAADPSNGRNIIYFTLDEDASIEIGLQADAATGDHWTVWQGFTLELCAPAPAIVLNAPTFNVESGTQAEPTMLPAGSTLKINYSAENLEANGLTEDDVKVKVTVLVSGDVNTSMTMGSETVHFVSGESFYIPLGETDFPVALKPDYYYQSVAVMAAVLVKPAAEDGAEDEVLATYAGAPVQLKWVGIEGDGTGINGINASFENAAVYDLSGRKVEKVQKGGVYIINGKKVAVK